MYQLLDFVFRSKTSVLRPYGLQVFHLDSLLEYDPDQ